MGCRGGKMGPASGSLARGLVDVCSLPTSRNQTHWERAASSDASFSPRASQRRERCWLCIPSTREEVQLSLQPCDVMGCSTLPPSLSSVLRKAWHGLPCPHGVSDTSHKVTPPHVHFRCSRNGDHNAHCWPELYSSLSASAT